MIISAGFTFGEIMNDLKNAIRERKKREENQKIEAILKAAKRVFYSKGYLKATMDDIALEAAMSKPLIYKHFKAKDDLFFSLMIPIFDESGRQMESVEKKLLAGKYNTGEELIRDAFKGFLKSYMIDPDAFKIVLLFQHSGMVWELNEETRSALFDKGRYNFIIGRRIAEKAIEQGLIKKMNTYHFVDTVWGGFLGIVRLDDTKSAGKKGGKFLKSTLKFFETLVIDALSIKDG